VAAAAQSVNFNGDTVGSAPKGWTVIMTGKGSPKWTVERDDTAPSKGQVLKQSGKATYPLALKQGTRIRDGFVEVRFKAMPDRRIAPLGSYGEQRTPKTTMSCGLTRSRATSAL
jgi:hypothetical protein